MGLSRIIIIRKSIVLEIVYRETGMEKIFAEENKLF